MRETLDPHYRKILEGLGGDLSTKVFEECVQDLLRDAYPGLVPIHGGRDAGMDAAISDGKGEAYPVVITTAQDVIRNLTRSLESYLAANGPRRRVVLATSTALTPTRRRNLEERARELGFTLVQVHEQRDLANRLYRNSHWTKTLLGLSGAPRALSAIPVNRRPMREVPLVGRDADLEWLVETPGDRVIVGQPGSGKTYLAAQLVREGTALFLTSDDRTEVANDLRDLQPPVVIVDDAHLEPARLERLRQLRQDIDADFDILATTWPGGEEIVVDALGGRTTVSVRRLELLTRAEIVEVLRSLGVQLSDDDPYLRLLVDQSANKPGLAVTLGSLWLRGERLDVATGGALGSTLIPTLRRVMEDDPTDLLACFALGGDQGVSMAAVSVFLQKGLGDVRRQSAQASQGGVLRVSRRDPGVLVVEPEPLRSHLLAASFFPQSSLPTLPYQRLIRETEDLGSAVETLVLAKRRLASVPRDELQSLIVESDSLSAWQHFALLGKEEAEWVLDNYPHSLANVASGTLETAPRATIPRLLGEAEQEAQSQAFLGPIRKWIQSIAETYSVETTLYRRELLVDEAIRYLDRRGTERVALRAMILALSPRLESLRLGVLGDSVSVGFASLPPSSVPPLIGLWKRLVPRLRLDRRMWLTLRSLIHSWEHPRAFGGMALSAEGTEEMREFAREMVRDLVPQAMDSTGLASQLAKLAHKLGMNISFSLDPEFECLFPSVQTSDDWRETRRRRLERSDALGRRWAGEAASDVVARLTVIRQEADRWGESWPGTLMVRAIQTLAESVEQPVRWLRLFVEKKSDPLFVHYLIDRTVRDQPDGWDRFVDRCLRHDAYAASAADSILRAPAPPSGLLDLALRRVNAPSVETACSVGEVPVATLRRLMGHKDQSIVLAAVSGEWIADPQGSVRAEVENEWRHAVLAMGGASLEEHSSFDVVDFWFDAILRQDKTLALDWLRERFDDPEGLPDCVSKEGVCAAAIAGLNEQERLALISEVPSAAATNSLLPLLVGASVTLYRRVLEREELRQYRLSPLGGKRPDQKWSQMAVLAVSQGADPQQIALGTFFTDEVYSPTNASYWHEWRSGFKHILDEGPPELREVATHGLDEAQRRIERAEQERRQVEFHGYR